MNSDGSVPAPTKRRLLFLLPWSLSAIGGVNEVVRNLLACVQQSGRWSAELLVADFERRRPIRTLEDGVSTIRMRMVAPWLPGQGLRYLAASLLAWPHNLFQLMRLLAHSNVDCVNVHYPGPSTLTLLLAVRLLARRPRVVLSFHGADIASFVAGSGAHRRLLRWLVRLADVSVCCSHDLLRNLQLTVEGDRFAGFVVHNGIDIERTRSELHDGAVPAELASETYIVNVGTFEEKKGQDLLLAAFSRVRDRLPELKLVLAGREGPWLQHVRDLVDSMGLGEHVVLLLNLPHRDALRTIAGARLFALTSRKEPFGIVLLEASVLNVPVVAMSVGGVPEIVVDGETGLLVASEDVEALAREIVRLHVDRDMALRLTTAAAARVQTQFTWTRAFRLYEQQYNGARYNRPGNVAPELAP